VNFASEHISEIRKIVSGRVEEDFPLSRVSSFGIGGPADLLVEPSGAAELKELVGLLEYRGLPRLFVGGCTNLLFVDEGFRGVVVRLGRLNGFSFEEVGDGRCRLTAEAGAPLAALVYKACKWGWSGLSALWGIPGTVGGAVVGNAGSAGASIGDLVNEIGLMEYSGVEFRISGSEIHHGYRRMDLPENVVVVSAVLMLGREDRDVLAQKVEEAKRTRMVGQPWKSRSAGCVFRNPCPEIPAGRLIEDLGFKGLVVGGAQVSDIHANFIVNVGGASSRDVLELIGMIRDKAWEKSHVRLDLEIHVVWQGLN
jgi:UDP-N-acetylmuramate dehydrogenase